MAASQRPLRLKLSRARRRLHRGSARFGLLHYLPIFPSSKQFLGEQYCAAEQDQVVYFCTSDMVPTRGLKAIHQHLTLPNPQWYLQMRKETSRANSLPDRSSGIGPMHSKEPYTAPYLRDTLKPTGSESRMNTGRAPFRVRLNRYKCNSQKPPTMTSSSSTTFSSATS
jgi:hypothetical protein